MDKDALMTGEGEMDRRGEGRGGKGGREGGRGGGERDLGKWGSNAPIKVMILSKLTAL